MDFLDVVLILVCIAFGMSGYRQGLVIGVLSFVGFIGGGDRKSTRLNSSH